MVKTTPLDQDLNALYVLRPSRLEDIDYALYNYLNDHLNIFTYSNSGFEKVPVVFSIGERAFQIKEDPNLRPNGRTLHYPIMAITKTGMTQDPTRKGRYGVNVPPYFLANAGRVYEGGGSINVARAVDQERSRLYANAHSIRQSATRVNPNFQTFPGDNPEVVYETLSVPMPQFIDVSYTITLLSEYQQQMNEMLSPFIAEHSTPSVFNIFHEGNRYEAFIGTDFGVEGNAANMEIAERLFRSTVTITVQGYIIGSEKNQNSPNIVRTQSAARLQIQRERVILGEKPHSHLGKKTKYRP